MAMDGDQIEASVSQEAFHSGVFSRCITTLLTESSKEKLRTTCSNMSCVHWTCWLRWRIWLTIILILGYILFVILWTSSLCYTFSIAPTGPFAGWYVASFFVMCNIGVSLITLREHWINYSQPYLQKYIIRISFMVAIYGYFSVREEYM